MVWRSHLIWFGALFGGWVVDAVPTPSSGTAMLSAIQKLKEDPTDATDWLEDFLRNITINIPEVTLKEAGLKIKLSGVCTNFAFSGIDSGREGVWTISMNAKGLTILCNIDLVIINLIGFPTPIKVRADIGEENSRKKRVSTLGGSMLFIPDGGSPPLPTALETTCESHIYLHRDLAFTGSLAGLTMNLIEPILKSFIVNNMGGIICGQVTPLIQDQVNPLLSNASRDLRGFLNSQPRTPSTSPVLPQESLGDWIDLDKNPGMHLFSRLFDVLGNPESPHSLNKLFGKAFPDGTFRLEALGVVPINAAVSLPGIGLINLTIYELNIGNLTSFSEFVFSTSGSRNVRVNFGMEDINVRLGLSIAIIPSGPDSFLPMALQEQGAIEIRLKPFSIRSSTFSALNHTNWKSISFNQVPQLACLAPPDTNHIQVNRAELNLPSVRLDMFPLPDVEETLEHDISVMVNNILDTFLEQYALGLNALASHAVQVGLRDTINEAFSSFAPKNECLPKVRTFDSETMLHGMGWTGFALFCLSAVIFLVLAPHDCIRRRRFHQALLKRLSATNMDASMISMQENLYPDVEAEVDDSIREIRRNSVVQEARRSTVQGARMSVRASVTAEEFLDPLDAEESDEDEEEDKPQSQEIIDTDEPVYDGLINAEELPLGLRLGMPVLLLCAIFLFLSADSYRGVFVVLDMQTNNQQIFQVPTVVEISILSLLDGMFHGGTVAAYIIVVFLTLFMGIWPYAKIIMLLFCWVSPTFFLPMKRRNKFLNMLDAFGKWSLMDIYMMIYPMHIAQINANISSQKLVKGVFDELGSDLRFNLFVNCTNAFQEYFFAVFISLVGGLICSWANRKVLKLGEYAPERRCTDSNQRRRRLCNILRPPTWLAGKLYAHSTTASVAVALVLSMIGIVMPCFHYEIGGLASLFGDAAIHTWSPLTMIDGIRTASQVGSDLGLVWTQCIFTFFTIVAPLVFMPVVLILWTCPLTRMEQKRVLIACQVLNALSSVEVFIVVGVFIQLAVNPVANYFAIDFCDSLATTLEVLMPDLGCHDIFDVTAQLLPGFWVLLLGALMCSVTGHVTLSRVNKAILAPSRPSMRRRAHSGGPFLRWAGRTVSLSSAPRASVSSDVTTAQESSRAAPARTSEKGKDLQLVY